MLNANYFASNQYRDYIIYKELAKNESNPEFKKILESLVQQEYEDYLFWQKLSEKKGFAVSRLQITIFKLIRAIFGLTFTAKFLEGREKEMIQKYTTFLNAVDQPLQEEIKKIIAHEKEHEQKFISQIKEDRIDFMGNIVLGLNDGLIELSGALVGFSFAFANPLFVAVSGIIVGLSATLSMAASAYMQAQHEPGKNAPKAAFYTGLAYLLVVTLLVTPFFISSHVFTALQIMGATIFLIILFLAFYSAVLLETSFLRRALEISIFSIGVAVITFLIGLAIKTLVPSLETTF